MYHRAEAAFVSVLGVVIAMVALAGCGSDDSSRGANNPDAAPFPAQVQKFSDCVREHGAGDDADNNVSPEKMQEALLACKNLVPQGTTAAPPASP